MRMNEINSPHHQQVQKMPDVHRHKYPFSSLPITSHQLYPLRDKKGTICNTSSEPFSCVAGTSTGHRQRLSFFVKYPTEFLSLYFPLHYFPSLFWVFFFFSSKLFDWKNPEVKSDPHNHDGKKTNLPAYQNKTAMRVRTWGDVWETC